VDGFLPNDNSFNDFFALFIVGFYFVHHTNITCNNLRND
jgi:hypothetical protein